MSKTMSFEFCRIPLTQIDREYCLTDFSLGSAPVSLETSIREIGVTHPLCLAPSNERYLIVSGHRRFRIAVSLGFLDLPAQILATADETIMLETNLIENSAHRQYSDVEKGLILLKLHQAGVSEDKTLNQFMPLLGLERSKKLYTDFFQVGTLAPGLRMLLHEMNVPLRVFSVCFGWDAHSLSSVEIVFAMLRPGVNKWREMLDLVDETARRENIKVSDLLSRQEIQTILNEETLPGSEKYDRIFQTVYQWRYPTLSNLKRQVLLALDRLKLDDKIKVRTSENFENGEIRIEFKFTTQEELKRYVNQLSSISDSEKMAELIKVFNSH